LDRIGGRSWTRDRKVLLAESRPLGIQSLDGKIFTDASAGFIQDYLNQIELSKACYLLSLAGRLPVGFRQL